MFIFAAKLCTFCLYFEVFSLKYKEKNAFDSVQTFDCWSSLYRKEKRRRKKTNSGESLQDVWLKLHILENWINLHQSNKLHLKHQASINFNIFKMLLQPRAAEDTCSTFSCALFFFLFFNFLVSTHFVKIQWHSNNQKYFKLIYRNYTPTIHLLYSHCQCENCSDKKDNDF